MARIPAFLLGGRKFVHGLWMPPGLHMSAPAQPGTPASRPAAGLSRLPTPGRALAKVAPARPHAQTPAPSSLPPGRSCLPRRPRRGDHREPHPVRPGRRADGVRGLARGQAGTVCLAHAPLHRRPPAGSRRQDLRPLRVHPGRRRRREDQPRRRPPRDVDEVGSAVVRPQGPDPLRQERAPRPLRGLRGSVQPAHRGATDPRRSRQPRQPPAGGLARRGSGGCRRRHARDLAARDALPGHVGALDGMARRSCPRLDARRVGADPDEGGTGTGAGEEGRGKGERGRAALGPCRALPAARHPLRREHLRGARVHQGRRVHLVAVRAQPGHRQRSGLQPRRARRGVHQLPLGVRHGAVRGAGVGPVPGLPGPRHAPRHRLPGADGADDALATGRRQSRVLVPLGRRVAGGLVELRALGAGGPGTAARVAVAHRGGMGALARAGANARGRE